MDIQQFTPSSSSALYVCVSVLLAGLQMALQMCAREERQTGSVLAPTHSSTQAVHLSLPPSHRLSTPPLLSVFPPLSVQLVREQVLHKGSRLLPLRLSNRRKAGRKGPAEGNMCVYV